MRANNRCEYCKLAQAGQVATFHIDHIKPLAAGGETLLENLACVSCSLRKSAKIMAIDPATNKEVAIYHPRQQLWHEHVMWSDVHIIGSTFTGRATVNVLDLNRPVMLAICAEEITLGRHPGE